MSETVKRVASLEDLKPAAVNVEVELEDGEIVVFPLRMPTFFDMLKVERAIPLPEAPPMGADKHGRPVRNTNDAGYLQSLGETYTRRQTVHLAKALLMDVPGDTDEAKADWLQDNLSARVMRLLGAVFQEVVRGGEARVEDRAATFHTNGTGSSEGDEPFGVDPGSVG